MEKADRGELIKAFRSQARACHELGSPFMAGLLTRAAGELERSGSIAGLLRSWSGDPATDAVPLRLAAALHALVLSGADPNLASLYPGGDRAADPEALWPAALAAMGAHRRFMEDMLASPPQTNEVQRSAVLLGGFLQIAAATTGRPMRLLEIGASAGLNLLWDRYHYDLGGRAAWGDRESLVAMQAEWRGDLPPLQARVAILERAGSDSAPVDLDDAAARLRLRAYVWADQPERMRLLEAAISLVRRERPRIDRADAASWTEEQLEQRGAECTTVLFHSIAWEYFPEDTKARLRSAIAHAGERAGDTSPLAWLRLEPPPGSGPGQGQPELRLTLWPGGREICLAQAHTHGPPVTWFGPECGAPRQRD